MKDEAINGVVSVFRNKLNSTSLFILHPSSFLLMRVNEFLNLVAQETRSTLPTHLRGFRTWKRYTLIQLYYHQRKIHYEVWVRGGNVHALEIGLHCEADAATNSRLLALLDTHMFEIHAALGEHVEAEQWTKSWTRVHELMPYEKLDEATARTSAKRLAALITVLQPILEPGVVTQMRRVVGKARVLLKPKT